MAICRRDIRERYPGTLNRNVLVLGGLDGVSVSILRMQVAEVKGSCCENQMKQESVSETQLWYFNLPNGLHSLVPIRGCRQGEASRSDEMMKQL
jgi:hypothetical protein